MALISLLGEGIDRAASKLEQQWAEMVAGNCDTIYLICFIKNTNYSRDGLQIVYVAISECLKKWLDKPKARDSEPRSYCAYLSAHNTLIFSLNKNTLKALGCYININDCNNAVVGNLWELFAGYFPKKSCFSL